MNTTSEGITYHEALKSAKKGERINRKSWHDENIFVFIIKANDLLYEYCQRSPGFSEQVKKYWKENNTEKCSISLTGFLAIQIKPNIIVGGWVPSASDVAADDWQILN